MLRGYHLYQAIDKNSAHSPIQSNESQGYVRKSVSCPMQTLLNLSQVLLALALRALLTPGPRTRHESVQRPRIFRSNVIVPALIRPTHAAGEVLEAPLHKQVRNGIYVSIADFVALGYERLETDDLAAVLHVQKHGE